MTLDNPYAAGNFDSHPTMGSGNSYGSTINLSFLIQIRIVAILLVVHCMLLAVAA
jgi:hypothetical protein